MSESFSTRAFLLRSVPTGEADKVVTLLTRDRGKLGAIARSARRSQKRFGGALEPFALLQVQLAQRPGSDLARLDRAEVVAPHARIATDLVRMGQAATALELARETLPPEHPEPALFDTLADFLERLDGQGPSIDGLVAFELAALQHGGFAPRLSECSVCGKPLPAGKAARFDPHRGGVVCRADGGGPLTLSGAAVDALARLAAGDDAKLPPAEARAAADAVRALTEWHLGRKLRSASFLAQVS